MNQEQIQIIMKNSGFKCQKCKYYSPLGNDLQVNKKYSAVLCSICSKFAPDNEHDFKKYVSEIVDGNSLESFRKFSENKLSNLKQGMNESAKKGKIVSRPAFGYKMQDGELIPAENKDEVREIFEQFASGKSLNGISEMHNLSVNGVKKILKNFTYVGKVKFDNQILQGNHQSIISSELFNRVQQRFENLQKENKN